MAAPSLKSVPPLGQSSGVRVREPAFDRAERRVSEYLRALGLSDSERVQALARELSEASWTEDLDRHAQAAVRAAQQRVERWQAAVFAEFCEEPDPLWLRAFLGAHPNLFLGDVQEGQRVARLFGDAGEGRLPRHMQFCEQKLEPARVPSWFWGLIPAVLLSAAACLGLTIAVGSDGLTSGELLWLMLFTFLFGLSAIGFCTALSGLGRSESRAASLPSAEESRPSQAGELPRTALVMPIYHESAEQVFAALAAMRESLLRVPGGEAFEIFVLSDSRDPMCAAEEERAFRRVAKQAGDTIPVFYRRRAKNERQKAGNLAEFFERWGHRYSYAIVLDADSLMTGETLVELVRRMEAAPQVALLQAPIALRGGQTLFARLLQFAGSLCGPVFTRGLAHWAGRHGNYYGHNAALRVRAFLDCCALPKLRGEAPLGGHILSHDFVEAALLCRAGWEVRLAHDLEGSYEGLPPTLIEYVARDRRWCQGNLQHLRIALARGLKPMSRIHLLLGAASYLAGPAWLVFLGLGATLAVHGTSAFASAAIWATGGSALMLLGPRLVGLMETMLERRRSALHGGKFRLVLGLLLELVLAAAIAPLLMLHHTQIVLSIVLGKAVGWKAQQREGSHGLFDIFRSEALATALGLATGAVTYLYAPGLAWWLAPVWVPWALAVPVSWLVSSPRSGALTRSCGLLTVPSESEPEELLQRAEELRAWTVGDESARFRDLVLDPVLLATHLRRLPAQDRSTTTDRRVVDIRQRALRSGPAGLSTAERQTLSRDAESMRWLHEKAWQHWPVESWEVSRDRPQVPEECA